MGSLSLGSPTSAIPEAVAISITAVLPDSLHPASTGSPNGPDTMVVRFGPPNTAKVPSPPSAIGWEMHLHPTRAAARSTAMHTSDAVAVPRNLSGAATTVRSVGAGRRGMSAQRRCRSGARLPIVSPCRSPSPDCPHTIGVPS